MKKCVAILVSLVFVGLLFGHFEDQKKADLVVMDGRIFTIAEKNPEVQAVAVKYGKILDLGTTRQIKEYIRPSKTVLDVRRKLILPGFIDAHCHFSSRARSLSMLDVSDATSVAYIQEKIAEKIKETPEGGLVSGYASFPNPDLYGKLGWPRRSNITPWALLIRPSKKTSKVLSRWGNWRIWASYPRIFSGPIPKTSLRQKSSIQLWAEKSFSTDPLLINQ